MGKHLTGTDIVCLWIAEQKDKMFDYLIYQRSIMGFAVKYTSKFYRQDSWDRYLRMALNKMKPPYTKIEVSEVSGMKNKTWIVK